MTEKNEKKNFVLYNNQISGKDPKMISEDGKRILKGYSESQHQFYQYLKRLNVGDPSFHFTTFVPKFYGEVDFGKQEQPQIEVRSPSRKGKSSTATVDTKDQEKDYTKEEQFQCENFQSWLEHLKQRYEKRNPNNRFIVLENLTWGFQKVNAMDIKIGGRNKDKAHKINFSVDNYGIKMNGIKSTHVLSKLKSKDEFFLSKYYLSETVKNKQDILEHIAFFFFDGQNIRLNLITGVVDKLKKLALAMKSLPKILFISSSVYITYDPTVEDDSKFGVHVIDFGRVMDLTPWQPYDEHSCRGIEFLIQFLLEIKQNHQKYHEVLQKGEMKIFKDERTIVVPERKIKQYEST